MHLCLTVECIASGLHLSVFWLGSTPLRPFLPHPLPRPSPHSFRTPCPSPPPIPSALPAPALPPFLPHSLPRPSPHSFRRPCPRPSSRSGYHHDWDTRVYDPANRTPMPPGLEGLADALYRIAARVSPRAPGHDCDFVAEGVWGRGPRRVCCCTGMTGLFVAAFPRSNRLALVLHGESQLHMHGLGLSGGYCVFVRCSVSALSLVSLTDPGGRRAVAAVPERSITPSLDVMDHNRRAPCSHDLQRKGPGAVFWLCQRSPRMTCPV